MRLRLVIGVVLAILLVYLAAAPAVATYYTYLAEDPAKQDLSKPGTENHVVMLWWLGGLPVMWWASETLLGIDADAAIATWTYYVPFPYGRTFNEQGATLYFRDTMCPGLANAPACLKVDDYYVDANGGANYTMVETIYVNPTPSACVPDPNNPSICAWTQQPWSFNGRKRIIARELGRLHGLQERYTANEQCNHDEFTVMDGVKVKNNEVETCDETLGPTPLDTPRVEAYWGNTDPTARRIDVTVSGWSLGPVGYFTWKDMAWAEQYHYIQFYYTDSTPWDLKHTALVDTDIGTHFRTEDRQVRWDGNRNNYGGVPGHYVLCVYGAFAAYAPQGYLLLGPPRCSNFVYLP
ncbi:MAG: hypothetical protein HY671_03205 [Chloroflexi bacterium]|nr:hypothetical protein [Chloroflexota bacterium]